MGAADAFEPPQALSAVLHPHNLWIRDAQRNDSDGEAMTPPFPHLERLDCNRERNPRRAPIRAALLLAVRMNAVRAITAESLGRD
jgi:hypothetical protein